MINRRAAIVGAGSALVASQVFGEERTIGLAKQVFVEKPVRIVQHCPLWCWAASAAMIFAMNERPIDQETIIQRVFSGSMVCTTGQPSTITSLLSDHWGTNRENAFQSKVTAAYDISNGIIAIDNNFIINELRNNRPLLYANKHHAMVVVSLIYLDTPAGPNVQSVGVLDPWPTNEEYHQLTAMEMVPAHLGGEYSYLAAVKIS